MILADKIIKLRKKNSWSQEELAEKMQVSRQAVSKWESAQTVPDLERILQLSILFGVSTDYLLKDEKEEEEFTESSLDSPVKRVSLAEAHVYLEQRKTAALYIAVATILCILSPVPLIILGASIDFYGVSENLAAGIGLAALFVLVTIAVTLYVFCGFKNAPYQFLEKEPFEAEYGVKGMVRERQKAYRDTYVKSNIAATCLCILSPLPLILSALAENEYWAVAMIAVMFILAGVDVFLFIRTGVQWTSMQKLLKEGEYTDHKKKKNKTKGSISSVYWLVAAAIYITWSFTTNRWELTIIVWPIAGVLFAAIMAVCNLVMDK